MALEDINDALAGYDAKWTYSIYAELTKHAPTLFRGASEQQIQLIEQDLSAVSGGGGLDLIALLLLPDSGASDSLKEKLTHNIQYRLNRFDPGKEYPIYLPVD